MYLRFRSVFIFKPGDRRILVENDKFFFPIAIEQPSLIKKKEKETCYPLFILRHFYIHSLIDITQTHRSSRKI